MLEAPPGDPFYGSAHLNTARYSATVVPAKKLEHGRVFLSNFKTKHSRPERRDSKGVFKQIRGGVKKDTCGGEQTARLLRLENLQRAKVPVTLPAATLYL